MKTMARLPNSRWMILSLTASIALSQVPAQALAQSSPEPTASPTASSQSETREARRAARKKKLRLILRKAGRTAGRASSAVVTATARPFASASGFLRGFFEREDKNTRSEAILKLLLEKGNHERLHELAFQSASPKAFAELMVEEVGAMINEAGERALKSVLHDIQPSIDLSARLEDIDMSTVDLNRLTPEGVRQNSDYQAFESIVGELDEAKLITALRSGDLNALRNELPEPEVADYQATLPHGLEAASTLILHVLIAPSIVSSISSVAASLYNVPLLLGYAGTGISVWQCLTPANQARIERALKGRDAYASNEQEQFDNDADLASFCQRVTNESLFKLVTARSKGYIAGKKAKRWFRAKFPRNIAPPTENSPQGSGPQGLH